MASRVVMPKLTDTMEEGVLLAWKKHEGDRVQAGEVIAEIETDKATMEVEAVDEGVLGKILVAAGTANVAVNAPIALILEDGEDASALSAAPSTPSAPPVAAAAPQVSTPVQTEAGRA